MASLRHPNIAQFFGVCLLEESGAPLLVMEQLERNVADFLESTPKIPHSIKLSILIDTCSGLSYLHSQLSPIIHRDLNSNNVLLNSSLSAKIADMGNSRIVNFSENQKIQDMTRVPGTLVYMPPEAFFVSSSYGTSLDIFSFGHLALYILTQVCNCTTCIGKLGGHNLSLVKKFFLHLHIYRHPQ